MRRSLQAALVLGLASRAAAIFQDEVGDIDFHYSLVGRPQVETTFFHRPRKDDKASLLYTLSDVGVLGAVNPSNGDVVWRHQIGDDGSGFLRAPDGEDWVVVARGSTVQAWNALTGTSVWHMDFEGQVRDLEMMELTETSRKDVLVLFDDDGTTVLRRLHGRRGTVVWEFRENSRDVPLQVSNNLATVYVVSLHGAPSSYNLKVTALDTATGARVDHWSVGSSGDIRGPRDVMFVGANSAAPIVAWADSALAKLSVNVLGTKARQDLPLPPDAASVQIHAPHLAQSQTHFLLHIRSKEDASGDMTNKAMVFHTDLKTGQINMAYELPHVRGDAAFATSSDGANVYFTQMSHDETLLVSSDSHGILARWPTKRGVDVRPVHAVTEVVRKAGGQDFAVRSAIVTTADDWTLIRNGEQDWTRREGLSGAVAAVWAEIREDEHLAKVLVEETHTNPLSAYVHRVTRHMNDLKHLPGYLASIPSRVVKSIAGGELVGSREGLGRDTFGFNKILVVVTRRGRFYGLDSASSGRIMWTRNWFPRDASQPLVVRSLVSNEEDGIVAMYGSRGEYAALEARTSAARGVLGAEGGKPQVSSVAVAGDESSHVLLPLGPDGLPTRPLPAGWDPDQMVVVRGEGDRLQGVRFRAEGGRTARQDMWELPMPPGQRIVEVATPPSHNPVASIGRVLGDRRVLYKYLNANSIVVAAADDTAKALSVRLVDTASGQVLAAQLHSGVDASKAISCAMADHWYACSFFADDTTVHQPAADSAKGYRVVVSDLYESSEPNSRGPLADAANSSSLAPVDGPAPGPPLPSVLSQAYVVSQPLTRLAVTETRQGITARNLVAYLPHARAILALSLHLVDPRRPVGRDPSAAELEAEGLARYAPALEIDPRAILSHQRDIAAVVGFVAAPAAVESTCLLAAYGIDVYVTRVAPSGVFDILGKGFSKISLLATVLALSAGVMLLAPMVRKRKIDRRWEAFL